MKFNQIPGQDKVKKQLIRTVTEQRVSHAQLFYGPEGSGKLALAIAYAQYINCTGKILPPLPGEGRGGVLPPLPGEGRGGVIDSCGVCPSCVKYQKLIHPDLHFIYPVASTKLVSKKPTSKRFIEEWRNFLFGCDFQAGLHAWYESIGIENKQGIINVDDCTDIITTLGYKSYEAEYKVMIIWMVERLYHAAAPKILKILEEPPEKTLFILVAEDPDQILPTIRSRTLMVRIPANAALMARVEEDPQLYAMFRDWMRLCYAAKIPDLVAFAAEGGKMGRERQKLLLTYSLGMIGHCLTYHRSGAIRKGASEDEAEFIRKFSPFIPLQSLPAFTDLFNTAIYHVERNAHGATLFLDLSLKIVRIFKPNFVPLS